MSPAKRAPVAGLRASERIGRIRARYQTGPAYISAQRASLFTQSWRSTETAGLPAAQRVALAVNNVYEKMTYHLDPDDRIAGCWTEHFLGIPIPIERGEYNKVLESELTKGAMIRSRAASGARAVSYMLRKRVLREFLKNRAIMRASGIQPLNTDFKTMSERKINNFLIEPDALRALQRELLPYWRGRCLVDRLEEELKGSGLMSADMGDFNAALAGNTSRQVLMLSTCATIASIQGHVILDYKNVLGKGLAAMKDELEGRLERGRYLPGPARAHLRAAVLALEGAIGFSRGIARRIEREIAENRDPARAEALKEMLAACSRAPIEPPRTFREAVQAVWTVKTAVEIALPINLQCFGRLDQDLYPFYRADIESGRTTPEQARELLEELLLKIMSQNMRPESNILSNFYHRFLGSSPVTVGGMLPDGTDGTNELTYLFVEAAHNSKAVTNLSIRVHPGTPGGLLDRVAECLHEGTSSYSIFNDAVGVESMRRRGFREEDARDYAIMGCVEMTCPGRTGAMTASALQLGRLLDITLRGGDSRIMAGLIENEGPRTGDPDSFGDFDGLVAALVEQERHFLGKIVEGQAIRDRLYERMLPAPHISAFISGCAEKMKDVTSGGAEYDLAGISLVNSIANLVDGLLVIKKLVYEKKTLTFRELLAAMDADFAGRGETLRAIKEVAGKWGNGDPETDRLAAEVMRRLIEPTYAPRNHRGGPFVVYVISMITHTIDGRLSIAGADGRRAATPFAASCNPYNVERAGVTASMRSVAGLPFEDIMGAAVNMKFHPGAIGSTPAARSKWAALVRTYFKLGGAQVQPTVASAEMLRAARDNPDGYRDLIVKVGGYSTYFTDLGREIQQEVIDRTEHR